MNNNFRKSYHTASKWAHQHMLVVGLGLCMCASMTLTQLLSYPEKVEAARTPTRCADNSGTLQIPEEECDILANLYNATDGDNWYNNSNRFQGDGSSICRSRYGVSNCKRDSDISKYRISSFNLNNNNLSGTLQSNFYDLPLLESFNLYQNQNLVINLDDMSNSPYASNFTSINVSNNIIYGNINNFINFSNIEYLDIACYSDADFENCNATGDTSFVPNLTKIHGLKLGGNTGVTFDLSYLETSPQLRDIFALNNYVIGDVSSLSGATGMQFLDISCRDILEGTCNVTGNLSFVQNMNNLQYLSLDALLNLTGTIDVLYDKTQLTQIDLSHNKISGTVGTGIGNLTLLNALDLDDNLLEGPLPEEMYNLTLLDRLRLSDNLFSGDLLTFYNFPVLRNLDIGATDMNYSNIREMVTPPEGVSSLEELNINAANIGGELPDIWDKFPSLQELNLQFNDLIGPFPASFALLTNLSDLQIRFNNLDGDIPSYLATLQLDQGKFAIEANCLNTDVADPDLLDLLNTNSPAWNNQLNCKANIRTSSRTTTEGLEAGQCGMYTIYYDNLGPQQAINLKIGQAFGDNIVASGSIPSYETGLVGRVYGTIDDPCYVQATQYATGPYFDEYEYLLVNQSQYPFNSIYELATLLGGYLGTEQFTGEQGTTEFAYVLDNFCPFVFGTDDHYLCLLLFGMDLKEIDDPSCGFGGNPGYIRKLGTVPAYDSGSIEVELCNQAESIETLSCTDINVDTISTNENQDICSLSVGGYCGDGNLDEGEQCDDGNSDDGDGCSSICETETLGVPEETPYCGDGNLDEGEQCDDGNSDDGDGCSSICETETSGSNGGGGGGSYTSPSNNGSMILRTDEQEGICKVGKDFSGSSYDRKCTDGKHNSAQQKRRLIDDTEAFNEEVKRVSAGAKCQLNEEIIKAYVFGFDLGLTTVKDPCLADLLEPMDRQVLSKIISMFAVNALEKKPETRNCSFYDTTDITDEMKKFTKLSCELKIMGEQRDGTPNNKFDPRDSVTREMFAVTVSRLMYGDVNNTPINDTRPRSFMHLLALNKAGIMKYITTPEQLEIKGYALTALMRAYLTIKNQ